MTEIGFFSAAFSVRGRTRNHQDLYRKSNGPYESQQFYVCSRNSELDVRNELLHCHDEADKFLLLTDPVSCAAQHYDDEGGPPGSLS